MIEAEDWGASGTKLVPTTPMQLAIGGLTPTPSLRAYFPSADGESQLVDLVFSDDWVYLPAVARELTGMLFSIAPSEIVVVSVDQRSLANVRTELCARLRGGLLEEWLGVEQELEGRDEADRLLQATTLELWRASGRDSLIFMRRCHEMQMLLDFFLKRTEYLALESAGENAVVCKSPAKRWHSHFGDLSESDFVDPSAVTEMGNSLAAEMDVHDEVSALTSDGDTSATNNVDSLHSERDVTSFLEVCLGQIISSALDIPLSSERVRGMGLRFGLDGVKPWSLEMVGVELGVTRERVRQIERTIRDSDLDRTEFEECFRQVCSLAEIVAPCSVIELNTAMLDAGLTGQIWSWSSLSALADFAGVALRCTEIDGFLCSPIDLWQFKEARTYVKKLSDRNGAASVEQLLDRFESEVEVDSAAIISYLRCVEGVSEFADGWMWVEHKEGRNRLVNTSKRILAVAQPQSIVDMHEGVERNVTWRNATARAFRDSPLYSLPIEILDGFYRSHSDFLVDGDGKIRSRSPISIEVLGPEKMVLVGILASAPHKALARNELIRRCHEEGMNTSTVQIFLTYAECIFSPAVNVWGLRGIAVEESAVAQLQLEATSITRSFDRRRSAGCWSSEKFWFYQRISPSVMYTGVVSIKWPADVDAAVRLQIIDGVDGQSSGTLGRSGSFAYGLLPVFRKNGATSGDVIRTQLIIDQGIAIVEIGGDELLEEPEDWSSY